MDELRAAVEAAKAYDGLFVPSLFGPWAPTVADAADLEPGRPVLDVACGTGVLAREAAARGGAPVVGLDPNPGMLAVARERAPELEWREGVAEELPFPDASFDAVVSQFGLMFFADRARALREMLRVLAPGGRLALAVWGALEQNPAYAAAVALLERVAGREAADALRAPFVLGDRDALEALVAGAGAAEVAVATPTGQACFPSLRAMVEADLRGWLPVMGVVLPEDVIERVLDEAQRELARFVAQDGSVRFETAAHVVSAAAP